MWRLNVRPEHLDACLENQAFAVNENYTFEPGEILLLQLVKDKNIDPHGRIKHYMRFVGKENDINNKSGKIWGKRFAYFVQCSEATQIRPFSLEDIQKSNRCYSGPRTGTRIHPVDEGIVMKFLKYD